MSRPISMPVVWTDRHRLHVPAGEVWVGVPIPGTEVPDRAEVIRDALAAAGAPIVDVVEHGPEPVLAVHDREMVDYLEGAHAAWLDAGLDREPGQDRVVPYVFPLPQLMGGRPVRRPAAPSALAGWFTMDTTTLIGPGTYPAARAAADAALTAAGLVAAGAPAAYACCRPPGHHAGARFFGGSCYLNNAAIAAQWLARSGPVAIVDIDAHHGNGTQQVFYERDDVFYGSVHVDPGAGWFPHFVGYPDETGDGRGAGWTRNLPLPPSSGSAAWLDALHVLLDDVARRRPDTVVVSLGVDGWVEDPESPLRIDLDGYQAAGEALGETGVPTLFVQEGGYDLLRLGDLVAAALHGFEQARSDR